MVKCCGEDRNTPFCPLCGTKLKSEHPLNGLLRHVVSARKGLEQTIVKKQDLSRYDGHDFTDKQKHALEKRIATWSLWENELSKLLSCDSMRIIEAETSKGGTK